MSTTATRRGGRKPEPWKARKHFCVSRDLLKLYEHLAVDLDCSSSHLVERAMRAEMPAIEADVAARKAATNN